MKVLICDNLEKEGVALFSGKGRVKADVHATMPPSELKKKITNYEGFIVRSASKVTAEVIEAASRLKVIGRAGIGLDNIDVEAASRKGIVVMNTPGANAITTAEHAITLLLSLSRHIPQANASLKAGKWEKKKFMGTEIFNQTLGVIGFGNIGQVVVDRAKGLKMRAIVYDPFVSEDAMAKKGAEKVTLDQLLEQSDYISIHTPLNKETKNLLNKNTFQKMKKGVRIINCARGGIVNERDLFTAIKRGSVAGAALDVFEKEPPGDHPLFALDEVIATPHLGASTRQAQAKVAVAIATQVKDYLENGTIKNAVNVPSVRTEILDQAKPYLTLAEKMGSFLAQITPEGIREVTIEYSGEVANYDLAPLTVSILKGILESPLGEMVNYVNAPLLASERGMKVSEVKTSNTEGFTSLITLRIKNKEGKHSIAGTLFGKDDPRIVRVDNFITEAIPEGNILFMRNYDKPGVIGTIGRTLGRNFINIAKMHLSRQETGGIAISLIHVDEPVPTIIVKKLSKSPHIISVQHIAL
jgi:D-3-phosphoglycerate dehydrogenase